MWQDFRYTVRTLVKHPGFLAGGILVLALGNGLNTAIFSVINAILYRPPPVRSPGELRYVYTISGLNLNRTPVGALSYRHFLELREQRDLFTDVALVSTLRERVRSGSTIDRAQGERVSSNYFDLLGVAPSIGRGFIWDEDEAVRAERTVVISHDLWRTRFLSDPSIIGRTLDLSSDSWFGSYSPWRPHAIVGVMPPGFKGMANPWDSTQYWVPFLRHAADAADLSRQIRGVDPRAPGPVDYGGLPIVRLRHDVTSAQAALRVADFGERVRQQIVPNERDWSLQLYDARSVRFPFDPRGDIVPGRLAAALMCVSGVVLLIAAANLAGMLLARGVARRSELALRLTLGASRGRLVRQLTAESLLLSVAGGAFGLLVARWLIDLFVAGTPTRFVRWQISALALDVPLDFRVMLFTTASCLVTGLFVGLVPARRVLRADLMSGLAGQSAATTTAVKAPLQKWVVIPQICLSLVLLLLAGMLMRTMIRAEMRSPGYDPAGVVLIDVETRFENSGVVLGPARSPERVKAAQAEHLARIRRLLTHAAAMPGVTAATVAMRTPMISVPLPSMSGWVAGREGFRPDGRHYWVSQGPVTPGYFDTLRIPLLRGRQFDDRDQRDSTAVAIVSETLARTIWPAEDPLGQHLGVHTPGSAFPPRWLEVVGVVGDVHLPLTDSGWSPGYYVPAEQGAMTLALPSTIAARGSRPAGELIQGLEAAVAAADPEALATGARRMTDGIEELLYPRRVAAMVLGLAGTIGLLLASSGLYGLISFSVAQRVREIGVRMALGADRSDVLRLIIREGLAVSGAGIALGFILTYGVIRIVSRFVVALPSMDLLTFCVVPTLLGAVILLACYIPALRAARVDPMAVLRGL
jgi:predicted permease